jgi:hypothetical protein
MADVPPEPQEQVPQALWEEFVPRIKAAIVAEYKRLPNKTSDAADINVDWMRAFLLYNKTIEDDQKSRASWFRDNMTGLMVISTIMALAFGCLGALGLWLGGTTKEATAGFLDIAKLFAGALVGAAGANVATRR